MAKKMKTSRKSAESVSADNAVLVSGSPISTSVTHEGSEDSLYPAEQVFEHLQVRVKQFQEALPEHYELGMQLANFGDDRAVHVRGMGYRNPNIVEFYGLLDGETQVAVVQHVSQLNFMLIAVPPVAEQEPYRIGFGAEI